MKDASPRARTIPSAQITQAVRLLPSSPHHSLSHAIYLPLSPLRFCLPANPPPSFFVPSSVSDSVYLVSVLVCYGVICWVCILARVCECACTCVCISFLPLGEGDEKILHVKCVMDFTVSEKYEDQYFL